MKVLVIGGTGLISSSITPLLVSRGDEVWVLTRGSSLRGLPPEVRHVPGDRTAAGFGDLVGELPVFDCVVDMVCFTATEARAAVAAFSGRTAQYVFTSTVDVYRKPALHYPYLEDEPYGGIGSYATNKVECEQVFSRAREQAEFPVTVIRPAATYGNLHLPVHSLGRGGSYLERLRRGLPIIVHGDGSSFWVSCHADDVAGAFLGAIGNAGSIGNAYHVTGEEWVTWNDHHAILARAIGAPEPELVHIPTDALVRLAGQVGHLARDNFQFNNIFDNGAAREDLGFRYTIPLREGLRSWFSSLQMATLIDSIESDPLYEHVLQTWRTAIEAAAGEATH